MTPTEAVVAAVGGMVGGVALGLAAWVAYAEKWWAPRVAGDEDDGAVALVRLLWHQTEAR